MPKSPPGMTARVTRSRRTVVVVVGLSGMAAALEIANSSTEEILLLEAANGLGGLAGSFEHEGRHYPLGYHHILPGDRALLRVLGRIGLRRRVRWRRVPTLLEANDVLHDLSRPADFARFPLSPRSKLRFLRLMLRCAATRGWDGWVGRSAAQLIDRWGDMELREKLFEPLCRIKFQLSCSEVSAAWIGTRLGQREGARPLGYVPDTNWTKLLCDGLTALLNASRVVVRTRTRVARLHASGGSAVACVTSDGESWDADRFIIAVPTETYTAMSPADKTLGAGSGHSALISVLCGTRQLPSSTS